MWGAYPVEKLADDSLNCCAVPDKRTNVLGRIRSDGDCHADDDEAPQLGGL
jgi:hypothetical protein